MNDFYKYNYNNYNKLRIFINKIYLWMSIGLLITTLISWITTKIGIIINLLYYNNTFLFSIILLQMFFVYILSNMIFLLSYRKSILFFILYSILNGISLSGIFFIYTLDSIYNVFLITTIMFICMTLYGYYTKDDLTNIGNLFLMLLLGIIIISLFNIFIQSNILINLVSYINIVIFTGLIAFDTQKLKSLGEKIHLIDSKTLNKYSILGALILYLDFINLFLIPLKIFNKKDKE